MKKKSFNKKLTLNKETISNLDSIKGGGLAIEERCAKCTIVFDPWMTQKLITRISLGVNSSCPSSNPMAC
ncbi:MAG: class I lanthipeptide [Bacteroidales bacterium]|nr:class I lanthipeptide [Bacteroidales bacterium]